MSYHTAKEFPSAPHISRFDRFLGVFSPGYLIRRHQATMLGELIKEGLIGRAAFKSSETDRLNQNWLASATDINSILRTEQRVMRNRSRFVCRNTADGPGAVNAIVNFVIGMGMTPQSLVGDQFIGEPDQGGDGSDFTPIQERQEEVFGRWSRNVDIAANPQCPQSFEDTQRMVMRMIFEDGESFIHQAVTPLRGPEVPLYYEFIPPESVQSSKLSNPTNGNPIDMGIEYVKDTGQVAAYWIKSTVTGTYGGSSDERRIPAGQMLHVFDMLYPGQRRGLPWMFAVLGQFFQLSELMDAELIGTKIAACFSVFFSGGAHYQRQVTQGTPPGPLDAQGNLVSHMQPGLLSWLPENVQVQFANPQKPGATFGMFTQLLQRRIGAGTHAGISYESLTRDTSRTNFAGIRASQQQDFQAWRPIQSWFARKYGKPTWDKVIDLAVMSGELEAPGYNNPLIGPEFWNVHEWVPSGWHFGVNPAQEVAASRDAVRAGLTNLAHECGLLGIDWRANLRMTSRVQREAERLGIVLTSDAGVSMVNGIDTDVTATPNAGSVVPGEPQPATAGGNGNA